ncbi:hypothetical protein EES41_01715 [Streptomyces sp. ADI95-16]|nr:hypothetical protein EES41_01715 [Streptomyces sp. ADI95-16]
MVVRHRCHHGRRRPALAGVRSPLRLEHTFRVLKQTLPSFDSPVLPMPTCGPSRPVHPNPPSPAPDARSGPITATELPFTTSRARKPGVARDTAVRVPQHRTAAVRGGLNGHHDFGSCRFRLLDCGVQVGDGESRRHARDALHRLIRPGEQEERPDACQGDPGMTMGTPYQRPAGGRRLPVGPAPLLTSSSPKAPCSEPSSSSSSSVSSSPCRRRSAACSSAPNITFAFGARARFRPTRVSLRVPVSRPATAPVAARPPPSPHQP